LGGKKFGPKTRVAKKKIWGGGNLVQGSKEKKKQNITIFVGFRDPGYLSLYVWF